MQVIFKSIINGQMNHRRERFNNPLHKVPGITVAGVKSRFKGEIEEASHERFTYEKKFGDEKYKEYKEILNRDIKQVTDKVSNISGIWVCWKF